MITGSPSIARNRPSKSRTLEGQQLVERLSRCLAAAALSGSVSARIIFWTIGSRSVSKNMCSVRHSPIPSAPNLRARRHRAGNRRWPTPAAGGTCPPNPAACSGTGRSRSGIDRRHLAGEDLAGRAVDRDPVAFLVDLAAPTVILRSSTSTSIAATPTTAGLPNWRATSAACDVRPPGWSGSRWPPACRARPIGPVSGRTMMTASSLPWPTSRPGRREGDLADGRARGDVQAGGDLRRAAFLALASNCGCR